MNKRTGFTLIEVLVVVAIIGLLAGILIPTLSKAKSQARRVSCASQLHQVGLAMMEYMHDSRDRMPWISFMPSIGKAPLTTVESPIWFADVLGRYFGGKRPGAPVTEGTQRTALQCPDDRVDNPNYNSTDTNDLSVTGAITRPAPNTGKTFFQSERSSYQFRCDRPPPPDGEPLDNTGLNGKTPAEFSAAIQHNWHNHGPQQHLVRVIQPSTIWFSRDYDNFHGRGDRQAPDGTHIPGDKVCRRYVYIDGHVSDFEN